MIAALLLAAALAMTHEVKADAAWYAHPAQATPPSGTLKKGTRVRVDKGAGGYSRFCASKWLCGWVQTSALRRIAK